MVSFNPVSIDFDFVRGGAVSSLPCAACVDRYPGPTIRLASTQPPLSSVHVTEVGILTIREVLEGEIMIHFLTCRRCVLLPVPPQQQEASDKDEAYIDDIDDHMHDESKDIPGCILLLENLRRDQVTNSPSTSTVSLDAVLYEKRCRYLHECCSQSNALFRPARYVSGDKRDDHISLCQEKLRAVESNKHASSAARCRFECDNDGRAHDGRNRP